MESKTPPFSSEELNPTREDFLQLLTDAMILEENWTNRDSAHAHRQLGDCFSLVKAGCKFTVSPGHRDMMLDVEVEYKGFNYFEDSSDGLDTASFYVPRRSTLDARREVSVIQHDWCS